MTKVNIPGLMLGIVQSNTDDQNVGRVQVGFPAVDDNVGVWAQVMYPGAGQQRGMFQVPEVGDLVVVGFLHGDANHPVVIGGLYNKVDTPFNPSGAIDSGRHQVNQRSWTSRKGHQIMLADDDSNESITIKSEDGNLSIVIDETNKKVTITSSGDVQVTAQQGITLEAQQGDVTIKADVGGITMQATGQTTIKGATVSIN